MKNRIVTIVSMIFLAVLCLGGCGNTELEERNFPLAAAVTLTKENYQMAFGFEQLKNVADEKAKKRIHRYFWRKEKTVWNCFYMQMGKILERWIITI